MRREPDDRQRALEQAATLTDAPRKQAWRLPSTRPRRLSWWQRFLSYLLRKA